MPCRYRASRFITESPDAPIPQYTSCAIEVYATNQLYKGRYVVSSVHISVGVTDMANQIHSAFEVYKKEYDVEDSSIYNYMARVIKRDSIWGSSAGVIPGVDINPSFDEVNNFAILNITQCDTRIKYRAYNRNLPWQSQLPGLTIQAPPHSEFVSGQGDYPPSLCGTPSDGVDLYSQRAKELGLSDAAAAVIYDILSQKPLQLDNPNKDICEDAIGLFANITDSDKADAINECAPYVVNPKVTNCLTNRPFAPDPFDTFVDCLRGKAKLADHSSCSRLQDAANLCMSVSEGVALYTC